MPDEIKLPDLPDHIAGVALEHDADEADPGSENPGTDRLLEAEASYLSARQGQTEYQTGSAHRTGLAFSGGGVRSAAFALGILQVLAGRRLLERFDYLSSVSGGGFTAGALIWFLRPAFNGIFGTSPADFPFVAEKSSNSASTIGSSSDSPMDNQGPVESVALLNFLRQHGAYLTPGHGITLTSAIAVILRGILLNLAVWIPIVIAVMLALLAVSGFDVLQWIAAGFGLIFMFGSLVYSFSTHTTLNVRKKRYQMHRLYETRMPWILWPLLGAATLASLPWAADASFGWIGRFGGATFVIVGLGVGLWSFLRPDNSWGVSFVRKRALPLGALTALYGVLLFAYQSALWLYVAKDLSVWLLAAAMLAIALLSGWFVNLNYISVQRFYRDRLMEVFMPDIDRVRRGEGAVAAEADGQTLSDCLDWTRSTAPYPLFNTHLPLASASSRRRRLRGGDNFVLSPLYCGSTATGWRRTEQFMNDGMTLPTAMAISGSVNHQQSGLGGVGLALNPLVSALKVLLNLRMGYWVPNPRDDDQSRRPNHFVPGFAEALAVGRDEEEPFLLLEDGGYFDNLGLYELIRRRLRLILVCDAGADADARLSDLHRVLRRVEVDFGARILFDEPDDYLAIIPRQAAPYPVDSRLAEQGHLIGRVEYADGSTGRLVYLKSALVPGLKFGELGYGSRRAGFPQETTIDQFFDEEQFDAHRRLGCELARRMIETVDLERLLREPDLTDTTSSS